MICLTDGSDQESKFLLDPAIIGVVVPEDGDSGCQITTALGTLSVMETTETVATLRAVWGQRYSIAQRLGAPEDRYPLYARLAEDGMVGLVFNGEDPAAA